MTVSPVYSDDDGSLQDFEVNRGHHGGHSDNSDYVENERGELIYQYQPPDDYQDPESTHYSDDEYFGNLTELMPFLPDVVQHVADSPSIPQEFKDEWNLMIEDGISNMDRFHELLEMFLAEYRESGQFEEEVESPDEEWLSENFDEVQAELNELGQTEFTYEQADTMASLAAHYQHGSAEQEILKAGIDLAFNKQTFQQAFEQITERFGDAAAAKAYYNIKQQIGD